MDPPPRRGRALRARLPARLPAGRGDRGLPRQARPGRQRQGPGGGVGGGAHAGRRHDAARLLLGAADRDARHRRRRRRGRSEVRGAGDRLPRRRHAQLRDRRRLPEERARGAAARVDRPQLPHRRGGARDPRRLAQVLGARRDRTGDRRRPRRLRPDLHVERLHRRPLQRAARPRAERGRARRLPDLPGRHPLGHRLLHERRRPGGGRDDGGADSLEPGGRADERPHPARGAVRHHDRRGGRDPRRAQQRPLHQRLADGRHEERRDRDLPARHREDEALALGRGSVRHARLPLGQQQRARPGGARRVRGAAERRPLRPGLRPLEPRPRLQHLLRAGEGADRRALGGAPVRHLADQPRARLRRQDHDLGDGGEARLLGAPRQGHPAREVPGQGRPPHARSARRPPAPDPRLHRRHPALARGEARRGESRGALRAVREEDGDGEARPREGEGPGARRGEAALAGDALPGERRRPLARLRHRLLLADPPRPARGGGEGGAGARRRARPAERAAPGDARARARSPGRTGRALLHPLRALPRGAGQGHLRAPSAPAPARRRALPRDDADAARALPGAAGRDRRLRRGRARGDRPGRDPLARPLARADRLPGARAARRLREEGEDLAGDGRGDAARGQRLPARDERRDRDRQGARPPAADARRRDRPRDLRKRREARSPSASIPAPTSPSRARAGRPGRMSPSAGPRR